MNPELRLLVERESFGRSFVESCKAAMSRLPEQPGSYINTGTHLRAPLTSISLHFILAGLWFAFAPVLPRFGQPELLNQDLSLLEDHPIVYVANTLPEVQDSGAASSGKSGESGIAKSKAYQSIRVYHGSKPREVVSDAPNLNLVHKIARVANVVAMNSPEPTAPKISVHATPGLPFDNFEKKLPKEPPQALVVASGKRHERLDERAPDIKLDQKPVDLATKPKLPVLRPEVAVESSRVQSGPIPTIPEAHAPKRSAAAPSVATSRNGGHAPDIVISKDPGDIVAIPPRSTGQLASAVGGKGKESIVPLGSIGSGAGTGKSGVGPGSSDRGPGNGKAVTAGNGEGNRRTGAGQGLHTPTGIAISGPVVHLPSFGSTEAVGAVRGGEPPTGSAPSMVVVASARSGGGLSEKLAPRGSRVYTIYVATRLGTAVLQYADPVSVQSFATDLTAPRPIKTDVPSDVTPAKAIIACVIDRIGMLRDLKILEGDNPQFSNELLFALANWRFRPVLRGGTPVEVPTVIGFGVKTQ